MNSSKKTTLNLVRAVADRDKAILNLTESRDKYYGLFMKAQGMLDHDEIKRLRHLCCKYVAQIKQLEEMRGIKWPSIDLPIM